MTELDRNLAAYEAQRADLESKYHGKWVVFHEGTFSAVFDTFEEAAEGAVKQFGKGPYVIKQVGAPPITLPASVAFRLVDA